MQPQYHIHPDPSRKPSGKSDLLIIDVSVYHLTILTIESDVLRFMEHFSIAAKDIQDAVDELSAILADHPLLQTSFENIKVIYHTSSSVLVPAAFYHEDNSDHLLHWQNGDTGNYFPMKDIVSKEDIHVLYLVPEELHHIMTINFPSAVFVHAHSSTVGIKPTLPTAIQVEAYPGEWICSVWKKGTLQLVKSLNTANADDLVYMILNICKQFDIQEKELTLSISGMVEKNDPALSLLATFIKEVHWDEDQPIYGFTDHPPHYFTPLIKKALCEL